MATTAPSSHSPFLPAASAWSRADTAPTALPDISELQQRTFSCLSEAVPEECSPGEEENVVRWGAAAEQGQRASMEDTHQGIVDLEKHLGRSFDTPARSAFFGVYDGHSGRSAAEFARDQLLHLVAQQSSFPQHLTDALRDGFLAADEQLYAGFSGGRTAGCTALTALVWGRHVALAHAGDSRAVLCRRGKAIDLTYDHKPTMSSEQARVLLAGGHICGGSTSGDMYLCSGMCKRKSTLADITSAMAYENSHLGVTRALGDFHLRQLKYKTTDGTRWQGPLIAEPEVTLHELSSEDEFIILACDGLWDVVTSQRAVELARQQLRLHNDPERAAQSLIQQAMDMHASDNVTVLIVGLSSGPPPARSFRTRDAPPSRILSSGRLNSLAAALADVS